MSKQKTVAVGLALLGGPLGLHRFYLYGWRDMGAWLLPLPSALGAYGVWRARALGLDDLPSWGLIPLLGLTLAVCALQALLYGLCTAEKWNRRHNPALSPDDAAGQTTGFTVFALVCALLLGSTVLMSTLAFSFQRYFEYQALAVKTTGY